MPVRCAVLAALAENPLEDVADQKALRPGALHQQNQVKHGSWVL